MEQPNTNYIRKIEEVSLLSFPDQAYLFRNSAAKAATKYQSQLKMAPVIKEEISPVISGSILGRLEEIASLPMEDQINLVGDSLMKAASNLRKKLQEEKQSSKEN